MPSVKRKAIIKARKMDLLTYLRNYEPYELVKLSERIYTTRTHDSLKISNGKWMWWSQGIGGTSALDYLIKVKGMRFAEAVNTINGRTDVRAIPRENFVERSRDGPVLLPEKSKSTVIITQYLFNRGIDFEIINYCIKKGLIYESLPYHNVIFVGYDENGLAKYAAYRATSHKRILGDCSGSKKQYSFRITCDKSNEVHLFESAIDLLSYATLCKIEGKDWKRFNLISMSGVYSPSGKNKKNNIPIVLKKYLNSNKNINKIFIHFDNDIAGRKATKVLMAELSKMYEVVSIPPMRGKDFNDFLCMRLGIRPIKERSSER